MCNKAVDDYPNALEFVPECNETKKLCDKAVDTYHSKIKFISKCFTTQEMCDRVASEHPFLIV